MTSEREKLWAEVHGIGRDIDELSDDESLLDYMGDNALELYYRITDTGEFAGAEITLGIGNPTIWIDTDGTLVGTSCSERVEFCLRSATKRLIWDTYSDKFDCLRRLRFR